MLYEFCFVISLVISILFHFYIATTWYCVWNAVSTNFGFIVSVKKTLNFVLSVKMGMLNCSNWYSIFIHISSLFYDIGTASSNSHIILKLLPRVINFLFSICNNPFHNSHKQHSSWRDSLPKPRIGWNRTNNLTSTFSRTVLLW